LLALVLAAAALAGALAMAVRRQRMLSRTRGLLALSPRLEPGSGGHRVPLRFAGPRISIRGRLETGTGRG